MARKIDNFMTFFQTFQKHMNKLEKFGDFVAKLIIMLVDLRSILSENTISELHNFLCE